MSDMVFDSVWALKFHQGNNHEVLHVINGHLDLTLVDDQKFHAGPGNTLIVPAQTLHRDEFDLSEDLEIFLIHFKWDLLAEYNKVVNLGNINQIDETVKNDLKHIFDQMRFDLGSGELDHDLANSRFLTSLLLIYRALQPEKEPEGIPGNKAGKNRRQWLVSEAKRYLEKNFRQQIQITDVAESLKISPFYLSRVFSRESDFSLSEYLTDIRLNTAKELLLDGRYIVADIANMVGYLNANYFSKVFKRRVGCSPTEYIARKEKKVNF